MEITADWCLTCKINHLLFLNNTEITSLFKNEGVIVLKGDYTNHDNEITNYLKKHNRYGIPFYVVYGEAAKDGIILSEVLTKNTIIGAIQKASKGEFAKQ